MQDLQQQLQEKKISELQIFKFRMECCTMLATIVAKIQERSPLKHLLARKLASLDPTVLHPAEGTKMFQKILESLIELKWKTSEQADRVWAQYRKFVSFRVRENRLNHFLYEELIEKRC